MTLCDHPICEGGGPARSGEKVLWTELLPLPAHPLPPWGLNSLLRPLTPMTPGGLQKALPEELAVTGLRRGVGTGRALGYVRPRSRSWQAHFSFPRLTAPWRTMSPRMHTLRAEGTLSLRQRTGSRSQLGRRKRMPAPTGRKMQEAGESSHHCGGRDPH